MANRLHRGIRRTTPRPESSGTPTAWGVRPPTSWSGGEPMSLPESSGTPTTWGVRPITSWNHGEPPTPWNQANPCHSLNQAERPPLGACDRPPAGAVANGLHLGIRRTTARPESSGTPTAWERPTAHQLEPWRTAYTLESGEPRHGLNQEQRPRLGACDGSRLGSVQRLTSWNHGERPTPWNQANHATA